MPLSWNEIKSRAITFAKEWEKESSEDAEAKSFWDSFFDVFGISRRRVATFETPVKKADAKQGFIDLLWKGVILVEHKSRGKDLDKAAQQAKDYFPGLKEHELPKYILVSDFQRFRLYDLDTGTQNEFELRELPAQVHLFGFIAGYQKRIYKEEDPVNIEAAERMGRLHDRLEEAGYKGHALEVYLVRLLFCLFAEDTGIFERTQFQDFVDNYTKPDGSDLALHLANLFQVLNTPPEKRLTTLDETLTSFPYVNGKLFEEMLPLAAFDSKMREMLLHCCALDWSKISPAIFGSMFQAVMNPKERRNLGAHYTSEKNIQKVIKPLFLDDLYAEFEKAKNNRNKLNELHRKIAKLRFLDPACGCGNFLIISYRELRELELLILRELNKTGQGFLNVRDIMLVDVDQFAGIEYDEFPARVAEVAMWLMDHQMNLRVSEEFGQYFLRLPLNKSAKIVHGNALRIDWRDLLKGSSYDIRAENVNIIEVREPTAEYQTVNVYTKKVNLFSGTSMTTVTGSEDVFFDYILGNPPFIGHHYQTPGQKADMAFIFRKVKGYGVLDYVSAWYYKAADFIQNTSTKVGFVSTNSISQGEQVGLLWMSLLVEFKVKIHFAHRTFRWNNEAKGNAAVHCVIIGFANYDTPYKALYEYQNSKGEPHQISVKRINPYLVEGPDIVIPNRSIPLCNVPKMVWGNKPSDGGYLIFTSNEEKNDFLANEPNALKYIRPFLSGGDFINGRMRWCLWLKDADPNDLRNLKEIIKRLEKVKEFRLASVASATRNKAITPTLFAQIAQPNSNYLAIPEVSSERRKYIPVAFLEPEIIASNTLQIIPNADSFLFGLLTSEMHMTWVRYVCGRLKSDFRYSNSIVYNNYPFPLNPTESQKKKVEEAAQLVLDTRAKYPNSSLADLYDPITMPPDLVKAHQALDKAVDLCYRAQAFGTELSRIEFLFGLYEQYTAPMFGGESKKKSKKN
ncbi:MAG: DNA methyltransferase [Haliscomenobacter sp.]|uniref:class I SAM-dependent DNA methyltransferase n=1 Tax=Haliscomenobacter sp. TaxID=2717303 RepID=UPI0029A4DF44|nr:DNA methyltransferase [Haliscomenobacter sp.]MDX2067301.1 DNA methyltransferase [Haliscomenobacter sp.]